jgi:choline dehydrogenase
MIYIRGNPLDYDNWRDAYGCTGWGHADLLPYFLRAEDQQRGGSAWHGTGGPLRVEDQRYEHPLSRAWLEAAIAWGLPGNEDFNGARQDGAGHYQVTQRGGRRWSAADAYLRPAMARPNLTVETGAHLSRPEPCSVLRRAISGRMPTSRTRRRYLSWSYPWSARTASGCRRAG